MVHECQRKELYSASFSKEAEDQVKARLTWFSYPSVPETIVFISLVSRFPPAFLLPLLGLQQTKLAFVRESSLWRFLAIRRWSSSGR